MNIERAITRQIEDGLRQYLAEGSYDVEVG